MAFRMAALNVFFRGSTDVPTAAKETNDALRRVDNQARRTGRSLRNAFVTRGGAGGIRNVAFQMQDFAVQVGAGTAASIALSQQLPQLLSGFGTFGAILGTVVAIAIPLVKVMRNLKSEGKDMTNVFGTMKPLADAVVRGFQALGRIMKTTLELAINNVDRLISVGIAAVVFFGGKWVAGFVAARIATMSLVGSLYALRAILLRLGITAIVVVLGEAVYQMSRLAQATGGWGAALSLVGDVFREQVDRWRRAISVLGELFEGLGMRIEGSLKMSFGFIEEAFVTLMNTIIKGLNAIFNGTNALMEKVGMNTRVGTLDPVKSSGALQDGASLALGGSTVMSSASSSIRGIFQEPLESVQKIKDLLASVKDEKITLPDLLGTGSGADEDGAGKSLDEKLTSMQQRIKSFYDNIKALTANSLSDQLGAWGNYFTNLVSLMGSQNERLLNIGKAFKSAQALMDAWAAYNQTLADPSLPWFAKFAAAGQVLAAGIGAVNAIKGVTSGGGGQKSAGSAGGSGNAGSVTSSGDERTMTHYFDVNSNGASSLPTEVVDQLMDKLSQLSREGRVIYRRN